MWFVNCYRSTSQGLVIIKFLKINWWKNKAVTGYVITRHAGFRMNLALKNMFT